MGLPTFARAYLKQKYAKCFSYEKKGIQPQVITYDLMKDVKYLPPNIVTLNDLLVYLTGKIKNELYQPGVETIIVLVDRKPLQIKRLVTHQKRYKDKDVLKSKEGPYLPKRFNEKVNHLDPWIRFAGNYKLLQRELYPLLLNAFLSGDFVTPRPGQTIILHGFPGYCEYIYVESKFKHTLRTDGQGRYEVIHQWRPDMELPITKKMEQEDPDLYNRVFLIENVPPCAEFPQGLMRREEWTQAKNDISEADAGMFYYDHFFQDKNFMHICNDGDVFSYGLLYSIERVNIQNVFRNVHWACLPFKLTDVDKDIYPNGKLPQWEYVDFNRFYIEVQDDIAMRSAGVQNNVATLVFLLILAESDYFKDYAKGIGKESIIWSVFRYNLSMFSHMVQLSKGNLPDTRTPRHFVIDEECFRIFIHFCYVEKYGAKTRKDVKREKITYADIKATTQSLKNAIKDPDYILPDRNKIRLWARQIDYNLHLYKNAPLGTEYMPNPFLLYENIPFYPYTPDHGMSTVVSPKRPPVDEVYEQNFLKNRKPKVLDLSVSKKQKIVEALGQ
jgi:hypothetical protein